MKSYEIATDWIKANKHASIRSIAKAMAEYHPDLWKDDESVRTTIRNAAKLVDGYSPVFNYNNQQIIHINNPYKQINQPDKLAHITKLPNVLVLDIETAPMTVYSWTLFKPKLSHDNIVEDWCILSWAAKWLHRPETISDVVTPKEAVNRDDKRICKSVFQLMEQADVIIAHNGKRFDIRKIQARFLIHGISQPSPYQVIDTLIESRKSFAHSSHRLDYLGQILVRKEKLDTDYSLWKRCLQGDDQALAYMDEYCRHDILLLEEVYMQIRGWIKSHPNMALYVETDVPICPTCASDKIEYCGEYVTMAGAFNSFRCENCGSIGRMRKSNLGIKDREKLRISTAR